MLGSLTLVAVREEHHEAARLAPLGLGGGDKLVDHNLGAVDEVAELALPEDERGRVRDGVAVLEPERGVLAQERVVDLDPRCLAGHLTPGDVGERDVGVPVGLVVEDRVALAERAAPRVLARQADARAVEQDRPEGARACPAAGRAWGGP